MAITGFEFNGHWHSEQQVKTLRFRSLMHTAKVLAMARDEEGFTSATYNRIRDLVGGEPMSVKWARDNGFIVEIREEFFTVRDKDEEFTAKRYLYYCVADDAFIHLAELMAHVAMASRELGRTYISRVEAKIFHLTDELNYHMKKVDELTDRVNELHELVDEFDSLDPVDSYQTHCADVAKMGD